MKKVSNNHYPVKKLNSNLNNNNRIINNIHWNN